MGPVERVGANRVSISALKGAGVDGAACRQVDVRQVDRTSRPAADRLSGEECPIADLGHGVKAGNFAQRRRSVKGPVRNLGGAFGPVDFFETFGVSKRHV